MSTSKICYIGGLGSEKSHDGYFKTIMKVASGKQLLWQQLTNFLSTKEEIYNWTYGKIMYPAYKFLGRSVFDIVMIAQKTDEYEEVMTTLLEQLPEDCTTLVGHSAGSYLAMELSKLAYSVRGQKCDVVVMANVDGFFNTKVAVRDGVEIRVPDVVQPFDGCRCLMIYTKSDPMQIRMKPKKVHKDDTTDYSWITEKRLWTLPIPHASYLVSKKTGKIIKKFSES